jgi:hypothetical protein
MNSYGWELKLDARTTNSYANPRAFFQSKWETICRTIEPRSYYYDSYNKQVVITPSASCHSRPHHKLVAADHAQPISALI